MGEEVDWHRVLVTAPQEAAKARESAAQDLRQAAARRARGKRLLGNPGARRDLARRWAAVTSRSAIQDAMANQTVYTGQGPPEAQPSHVALGSWYMDELTGLLYRLEA